jgi:1,2-diacylglycerol 3-beta-glucosyltransferase
LVYPANTEFPDGSRMIPLAIVLLVPATAACLHYAVLLLAARRTRAIPFRAPSHRFAVLIPAHDEELSLPATLRSLREVVYPGELLSVVVVADNCADNTANVARAAGATVLERTSRTERGKGYALRFGLDAILAERPDAVLILDADCQVDAKLFRALDARLAGGAEAVQVAVTTRNADDGPTGYVGAIGNAFDNALSSGKDRLGLAVPLRGSGMAFRRDLLERFPWTEYGLVEDADYAARLRAGGVRVRFEPEPLVRSESPARRVDLVQQRRRWRAAVFGGSGLLVNWIESKPLVLLQLALAGAAVALSGEIAIVAWFAALVAVTGLMYARIAFDVGMTRRRMRHLAAAPGIVLRLAFVTLGGFGRRDLAWQRTRRAAEPARN